MSKARLFLYDFVAKTKIRRYLLAIFLFATALFFYHRQHPEFILSGTTASNLGLSIAFMTTMYSLFSYSTLDRIKAYLMLPCQKSEVFFAFIFAQFFSLLLERLSFVIVAAAFFSPAPVLTIIYLLLTSLLTVILDVIFMMCLNRRRFFSAALPILLVALLYLLFIFSSSPVFNFSLLALLLFFSIFSLARFSIHHLIIRRASHIATHSFRRFNYFFLVLTHEKITLVNTVVVFLLAAFFAFTSIETPQMLSLIWGIVAMNTLATTMFSADKALLRHSQMLPRHSRLFSLVYASFLFFYFALANLYVIALFIILGRFHFSIIFLAIFFTFLATALSLFLERRFPLRVWQKKQEVYRHPRKYILPVTICLLAFLIALAFPSSFIL